MSDQERFKAWMKRVDVAIDGICGLSTCDLADQHWYDWYASGVSPADAAVEALENEGFFEYVYG